MIKILIASLCHLISLLYITSSSSYIYYPDQRLSPMEWAPTTFSPTVGTRSWALGRCRRQTWQSAPTQLELAWIAASRPRDGLISSSRISSVIAQGYTSRLVPMGVATLLAMCFCWFYRSYRFRQRQMYRLPHDAPD